MIIKLTAEFNSIDSAEFACKDIKNKAKSVTSITITEQKYNCTKNNIIDNLYFPSFFLNQSVNALPLENSNIAPFIIFDNEDENNKYQSKAKVEVICDFADQKLITQSFLTYGGLKINKI